MQSLREKLLEAGLISEEQHETAQTNPARERNSAPSRNAPSAGRPPQAHQSTGRSAPIPKLPPLAVPNNKELQRLEAKKQLELERRIRELVIATEVEAQPGEQTFYFVTRKNRLRRMELAPELARRLESGELAVVERPEPARIEHSIVPATTADQILELNSRAVRFYNRENGPVGFLSDEELSRRQRAEADQDSRNAGGDQHLSGSAPEALIASPEDPTGFGHPITASETQHLAVRAESDAARSCSADD